MSGSSVETAGSVSESAIEPPGLTKKQETFCLAYIETGNASEAYRRAYDAERMGRATVWKRASELMHNGEVEGRIGELRRQAADRALVSVGLLAKRAERVYERAMQAEPVLDREGNETGMFTFQAAGAMRALEFLAKLFGHGSGGTAPGEKPTPIIIIRRTRPLDE